MKDMNLSKGSVVVNIEVASEEVEDKMKAMIADMEFDIDGKTWKAELVDPNSGNDDSGHDTDGEEDKDGGDDENEKGDGDEDPEKDDGEDENGEAHSVTFKIDGMVLTEIDQEKVKLAITTAFVEGGIAAESMKDVILSPGVMRFLRRGFFDAIKKGAGAAVDKVKDFMGMGDKEEEAPKPAEMVEALEESGAKPEEIAEALEETGASPKEAEAALEETGVKDDTAEEAVKDADGPSVVVNIGVTTKEIAD